ncbi:Endonuclease/exonuclease/phosphatase [Denitrovibrio acetiphilus DSM 12809]|uniref:Endonuclease/exonuclease/phosphatase n=1 Tax=Denitrovibrio acetiphilus (strain DSM 12809 / NBRC 114555 / N2460) TaxID=522772 RepID=D4H508_DENA2|nr:endonuclease/exonuclease/phosphatase [Denitrovibrio acetiphilus]ADD69364.1 Endonuclease/exonuclease/phosphatase [Denitrovibrio acetiphilus DSM 12809]
MKFISYNVHGWVGTDGVRDFRRALGFINESAPDAAALQEVVTPVPADNLSEAHDFIQDHSGMYATFGQTMLKKDAPYGNVLLTREKPLHVDFQDISVSGYEPRGVIIAEVSSGYGSLTILTTHLGLNRKERVIQAGMIRGIISGTPEPTVLMCDCNEWYRSRASKILDSCLSQAHRQRTFPSKYPILALDMIRTKGLRIRTEVIKSRQLRVASDHLPLAAEVF